ncbi:MAG: transcription elongation factor GreA [Spirochaetaceae bacterium]|jgi:transcription elongation factor GreA|nr:transcription elongation factor GreA [Spirochaetaceae bacterium]
MSEAVLKCEELLKNVQERLNEEKWTRATLSNYSTAQFEKLDLILKEAMDDRAGADALKDLCDEHLIHTKNSIIALYLSGMIALSRRIIDDSALMSLVTIFVDNHKGNIVRYLCDRILDCGESKFALRTLAECYKNDHEDELVFGVWERLVRVDLEETDVVKALAEHFEKEGDIESAIEYYKKALYRYINKQTFTNVREIWEKLLSFCPEDIDFFLHLEKKIAKNISDEKSVLLLQDLCKFYKEKAKEYQEKGDKEKEKEAIDTAISLLKIILQYDEKDSQARKDIIECFKTKYAGHSQLDEYIRVCNLLQNWRNIHEAIADFEKHIAFDKGNFVYHRTWGVGRIASVQGDDIVIDFAKARGHEMSLKMAVNALQTLAKDHIWVLKATWKKEKLREKIKTDFPWALRTVIKSFGNSCDFKRIKAEFAPAVLTVSEWTAWSGKAREILKSDPSFGVSPENIDVFTVRERPISIEEKLFNEFKAQRQFFDRVDTLRSYIAQQDAELDSEYFTEMFAYFAGFLKSYSQVNECVIASYLFVKDLIGQYPHLGPMPDLNFLELFEDIEDLPSLFASLKDPRFRDEFLKHIKLFIPDWADVYLKLFPYALSQSIIQSLKTEAHEPKLIAMTIHCFENYRDYRDAAVWLFKNCREEPWFKKAEIPFEKQLITLIHILDISFREIENHRDTSENRRVNKQAYTILFKDGLLNAYLDSAAEEDDRDAIIRLYTFINDVKDLDPADKFNLRNRILEKYPDFKFFGDVMDKTAAVKGLIVTKAKYEEKQKQLAKIKNEEVPANSREIGFALSLGDLRENAEYKAAKEKQEILNATVAKLEDEINRAQLFDPRTINTSRVSFGTKVVLQNAAGAREAYTILGPWESDPENQVISYLSPFGGAVLNKTPGERFEFSMNDEKISYTVEEISAAVL